jgi:hypothetical protein
MCVVRRRTEEYSTARSRGPVRQSRRWDTSIVRLRGSALTPPSERSFSGRSRRRSSNRTEFESCIGFGRDQ